MKCPTCENGELYLYKETERIFYIPLNKNNTLAKSQKRWNVIDHETVKDYLECDTCDEAFDYHLDDDGKVILEGERVTGY